VTSASASGQGPSIDAPVQHLTFRLGTEDYAIEVGYVHEIKSYAGITPIPNAPAHIKGVMNLRGTIVPVVDLRDRFNMPLIAYDKFTVIVVVSVLGKLSGIVVDAVTDLVSIGGQDIDPPPDLGADVDTSFIRGMAKTAERLAIVLDLEKTMRDVMNYRDSLATVDEGQDATTVADRSG
jgi:purine-binding chemotaxis protein CheW